MADLDLIPHEYRHWLRQRRILIRYAASIVALGVACLLTTAVLAHQTSQQQADIAAIKSANQLAEQQIAQIEQLAARRTELEHRWSLLRGLRAGTAIDEIFTLIDDSIGDGELWFLNWSFRRAGIIVDGEKRGIETGYFILVNTADEQTDSNLSVETHMTIHGQARDHQALSRFVRALFEQPGIKNVSVQKTSQAHYGSGLVIDFDMTLILYSDIQDVS